MTITIDYDQTLTQPSIQKLAKWLTSETPHEVFIITKRYDTLMRKALPNLPSNDEVYDTAKKCGIKPQNIIFTNQQAKLFHIQRTGVSIHIDDDKYELANISSLTECKCFNSLDEDTESSVKDYLTVQQMF